MCLSANGTGLASDANAFDVSAFLKTLTHSPGVYRMCNEAGEVLYVGKARSLRNRLKGYFRAITQLLPKTRLLMAATQSVEITVTHTEIEALLLENNLIKEHQPRYNILLRDDKSFPYIHCSSDSRFPRFSFYRGSRKRRGRLFGPFASASATRETLNQLYKLFRIRQCDDHFFNHRTRACLQYQIKRCSAPCVGFINEPDYADNVRHGLMFLEGRSEHMIAELARSMETASDALQFELAARYRDQIASLRLIQTRQYVAGLRSDLDVIAVQTANEIAVVSLMSIRNGHNLGARTLTPLHAAHASPQELLAAFIPQYYLNATAPKGIPPEIVIDHALIDAGWLSDALGAVAGHKVQISTAVRGMRDRLLRMANDNARLAITQRQQHSSHFSKRFKALQQALGLASQPCRIECFDISHTSGNLTVAACVVFGLEGPIKSDYRRFNLEPATAGDDYAAMREVLHRRYKRLKQQHGKHPDMVLVDGGKGQLKQALLALDALQIDDLLVGAVAKGARRKPGLETLYFAHAESGIALPADSPALHLIQHIRDEAHRFAISGHRQRRRKSSSASVLECIPNVGPKRRQRLLQAFGGLQGVMRAGVEDLARIDGISKGIAKTIYETLHKT